MNTAHALRSVLPASDAATIDADVAALDAHTLAVEGPWRVAFRAIAKTDYQVGDHVWLFDHYNTATIVAQSEKPGMWVISTLDADGRESRLTYREVWMRPALEPRVFTWPSSTNN